MIADIEVFVDANGRLINKEPAYDNMLNAEVVLQLDGRVISGQVKKQALGP